MRKQLYLLVIILMVFFAFYSVYYYSNYRVRNLPVIGSVSKLSHTQLVLNPKNDTLSNSNLVYSPCMKGAWEVFKQDNPRYKGDITILGKGAPFPRGRDIPDNHCIVSYGKFSDTTKRVVGKLQNKWFDDDFQFRTHLKKGTDYIFSHFYHKLIFKNSFRVMNPGLLFGGDTVKAVKCLGKNADGGVNDLRMYRNGDNPVLSISSPKMGRVVYAVPSEKRTLWKTYRQIVEILQNKQGRKLKDGEQLIIPLLDFHLTKKVPDLVPGKTNKLTGVQRLSLIMNAEFSVLGGSAKPEKSNEIRFDEPFLLFYQRKAEKVPSLLAWVTHPELLLVKGRKGL